MGKNFETVFDDRFKEYIELKEANEYYGAISILAQMLKSLPILSKSKQSEWARRLNSEPISEEIIEAVLVGINRDVNRLKRILSVGSRFNDDEIVLVLTLRYQIEVIMSFLFENCSLKTDISLDDIDSVIQSMARSNENKRAFGEAINQIKRNSRLPFDNKLLNLRKN